MSEPQLVSADPAYGTSGTSAAHPEAQIGALPKNAPVTLGDLKDDPVASIKRIGVILGEDVSDPKLWLTIAASYLAPKLYTAIAPGLARAAAGAMRSTRTLATPGMAKDVATVVAGGSRVNAAIGIAGRVADAAGAFRTPEAEPPAPVGPVPAPVTPAPAPTPTPTPTAPTASPSVGAALRDLQQAGTPLKLTAAEMTQGLKWIKQGVSSDAVLQRILSARDLTARLGTMTPDQVRADIAHRNDTGKW